MPMHFILKRVVIVSLCMLFIGVLCDGCSYDSYWSLIEASIIFGLISSAFYWFSVVPRFKFFFQKIALFSFLVNTFVLLILGKFFPGFHLASASTALWMSFLIGVLFFGVHFIFTLERLREFKKTPKIKSAKAKVISSKKNTLQ